MKKKLFILIIFFSLAVFKTIAQNAIAITSTKKIQSSTNPFLSSIYSNPQVYTTGLIYDLIEKEFWSIQKSGLDEATRFKELNTSVDIILNGVKTNEKWYNDLTKYLFQYFEKYSLFAASEYIALKALSQQEVTLNMSLVNKLESYRSMKVGNIAPDIELLGDVFINGLAVKTTIRLSEINTKYKLVVFGGSWCDQCSSEINQILLRYDSWKSKEIEVVFISLDTEKEVFNNFASKFPFISSCDYKIWDTQAAKAYYVSSSPTIFLLDSKNKIVLRPPTIMSIDEWLKNNSPEK
jgi:thioredoxin-related protein